MLYHGPESPFILRLSIIPLCIHTTFCLSIHLSLTLELFPTPGYSEKCYCQLGYPNTWLSSWIQFLSACAHVLWALLTLPFHPFPCATGRAFSISVFQVWRLAERQGSACHSLSAAMRGGGGDAAPSSSLDAACLQNPEPHTSLICKFSKSLHHTWWPFLC